MKTNNILKTFVIAGLLSTSFSAIIGMINAGSCCMKIGSSYTNNGQTNAKTIKIDCGGTLSGNGKFSAEIIILKTKKFDFKGTIECSGECLIMAEEEFDPEMFTRKGNGKFIIKIGKL